MFTGVENNNLYSVQQTGEYKDRPEPKTKFVAETHISPQSLHFETKKKTYADIVRGDMPHGFLSGRPDTPPIRRGSRDPPFEGEHKDHLSSILQGTRTRG